MPKKVAGQHFEDLDLLTKLLQPKVELPSIKPKGYVVVCYDMDLTLHQLTGS